jgi:hypothetical protein
MDFLINSEETKTRVKSYIDRLDVKRAYKVKIEVVRRGRSLNQNNYMWLVFTMLADEFGESKEVIHDFFCDKFLQVEDELSGVKFFRTRGTSELKTVEHSKFMQDIVVFCASEWGIIIPDPDEVIVDNL